MRERKKETRFRKGTYSLDEAVQSVCQRVSILILFFFFAVFRLLIQKTEHDRVANLRLHCVSHFHNLILNIFLYLKY